MSALGPRLVALPRRTLIALVRAYRFVLKPWLGNACRFEPSCSAYALEALQRHGALAGSALSAGATAALPPVVPRRTSTRCPSARPAYSPDSLPRHAHDRYAPHLVVAGVRDVARPVVGCVEQAHRRPAAVRRLGRPVPVATASAPPAGRSERPARRRCRRRPARRPHRAAASPRGAGRGAGDPGGELITLTTNQVKATIDTRGGELVRLELLHFIDHVDRKRGTSCCSTAAANGCTWRAAGWPRSMAWRIRTTRP